MSAFELPVVHVVLQEAISGLEEQVLEDLFVVQDVQRIEDIELLFLGEDECCGVHLFEGVLLAGDDIVGVGRVEVFVVLALEDGRWQMVERDEAGYIFLSVLDDVARQHFISGQEEVFDFFLRVFFVQLELAVVTGIYAR